LKKSDENDFNNCSVPLAFKGRYFILEPGNPPSFSVILEHDGKPAFEIKSNEPCDNPVTDVSISSAGIVTALEKGTGKFLYKFRPEPETCIVFGQVDGSQTSARISDKQVQVGDVTVRNCMLEGIGAGIALDENGGVGIGAPIPPSLLALLGK